jgi:hypothetical protein
MSKKPLLVLALAVACCAAQAQSTPAKKELVARILKAQQPGIEALGRNLAEDPARGLIVRAQQYMAQRVPQDKQQAVAKTLDADLKKYLDEAVPIVTAHAVKIAPTTVGPLLEEKFSEDELKQVLGFLESPVYHKFQQIGPDMQKALLEKLVADMRPTLTPKAQQLEQTMAKDLGIPPAQPAASGAKPPAKPASR